MRCLQPISITLHLLQSVISFRAVRPDHKSNYIVRDYLIKEEEYLLNKLKISKDK